jgi:hypothetical protein
MTFWENRRHGNYGIKSILRTLDSETIINVFYVGGGADYDIIFLNYDPERNLAYFTIPARAGLPSAANTVEASDIIGIATRGH